MAEIAGNGTDSGHKLVSAHGHSYPGERCHGPSDLFFTSPVVRAPPKTTQTTSGPRAIHPALRRTTRTRLRRTANPHT